MPQNGNDEPDLVDELRDIINESKTKEWFRTTDLADYLNISLSQVHVLKNDGVLPYTKLAGTIYFERADIDKALEANKVDTLH